MILALILLFVLCPVVFLCGMGFQRMLDRERRGGYIRPAGFSNAPPSEPVVIDFRPKEWRGGGLR